MRPAGDDSQSFAAQLLIIPFVSSAGEAAEEHGPRDRWLKLSSSSLEEQIVSSGSVARSSSRAAEVRLGVRLAASMARRPWLHSGPSWLSSSDKRCSVQFFRSASESACTPSSSNSPCPRALRPTIQFFAARRAQRHASSEVEGVEPTICTQPSSEHGARASAHVVARQVEAVQRAVGCEAVGDRRCPLNRATTELVVAEVEARQRPICAQHTLPHGGEHSRCSGLRPTCANLSRGRIVRSSTRKAQAGVGFKSGVWPHGHRSPANRPEASVGAVEQPQAAIDPHRRTQLA
eukprot:6428712-Prymnesium_polylepis.2